MYKIIEHEDRWVSVVSEKVEHEVQEYMKKGYVPLGGISISYNSSFRLCCVTQAMIKK